jgi:RNA polymerase subunit RPABC4/transcription elongation factor Spt4
MLIRCVACNKLIYSDDTLEDGICPACGSTETETIAMSIVFDQTAVRHAPPVSAPEHAELPAGGGKHRM